MLIQLIKDYIKFLHVEMDQHQKDKHRFKIVYEFLRKKTLTKLEKESMKDTTKNVLVKETVSASLLHGTPQKKDAFKKLLSSPKILEYTTWPADYTPPSNQLTWQEWHHYDAPNKQLSLNYFIFNNISDNNCMFNIDLEEAFIPECGMRDMQHFSILLICIGVILNLLPIMIQIPQLIYPSISAGCIFLISGLSLAWFNHNIKIMTHRYTRVNSVDSDALQYQQHGLPAQSIKSAPHRTNQPTDPFRP